MILHLISHDLCPYVQRAMISLAEKGVDFERSNIDLGNKPDWFLAISPLGKTPVLLADGVPIFESAVILEYLEETQPNPLHPGSPLERARHRAWMEFGSATLNDIAGFYSASDERTFAAKTAALRHKFEWLEGELGTGPYFSGDRFSLVDVVFGPVFRYFDTFDRIADFGVLVELSKVGRWRRALADRPSVAQAVSSDYPHLLERFIERRGSRLSRILEENTVQPGSGTWQAR
ncbi:MAG: glutathione S-transferase family protein [Limimaricola soesokkakensis]|uniref:glutathione S-transferase family protein n=1 Tax=Limimaricola soesokkakensis TaxID=1343159 RepID=UPI004059095E